LPGLSAAYCLYNNRRKLENQPQETLKSLRLILKHLLRRSYAPVLDLLWVIYSIPPRFDNHWQKDVSETGY
jgi:hypothetical protein